MRASLPMGLLAMAQTLLACLLPEERANGALRSRLRRRQAVTNTGIPVGTGDRFSGGTKVPQGLGSQPATTSFSTLLNPKEVASGMQALANTYGITVFTTPFKTYEGNSLMSGRLGGTGGNCSDAYRVYINANIHARERGAADHLLYFASDLLYADKNNLGLTYGDKTYTAAQVKTAMSTGVVFTPLANPDGVAYDQQTNSCWRKNRNPASGTGDSTGVDLNRNFDFLWDVQKYFAKTVAEDAASTKPSDETFHGTKAFSEPETQSIKWIFDNYPKVRWFVDLHSFAGDVLYSWGNDDNQSKFPFMNFKNDSYASTRGVVHDTPGVGNAYGEYITANDLNTMVAAAQRLGDGLSAGGGQKYQVMQAVGLYPTAAASDDYAYSRHFIDPTKNLVYPYTVEFGFENKAIPDCPFYPTVEMHNTNIKATGAGFMEFLLAAVDLGLGNATTCSTSTKNQ